MYNQFMKLMTRGIKSKGVFQVRWNSKGEDREQNKGLGKEIVTTGGLNNL